MDFLKHIFSRYQRNESEAGERQLVDVWYEATGEFPLPHAMTEKQVIRSEQLGWQAVAKQLGLEQRGTMELRPVMVQRFPAFLRYAAIFIIIAGSAWGFWQWQQETVTRITAQQWRTITTGVGQRKKLLLPDSSEVWLNNATTIRIAEEAYRNDGKREIWIDEGEAYFEVVANQKRPFTVHVDSLETLVLGTSFNVLAYRSLQATQVSVQTGKVRVRTPQRVLATLEKQEVLTCEPDGSVTKTSKSPGRQTGWWSGKLVLDHAGFSELSVRMKARYGIQLQTNNTRILHTSFSAGFNNDTPLKQVLEVLCTIYKTSYTVAKGNNTIIIH